jgi:hypothetical protein
MQPPDHCCEFGVLGRSPVFDLKPAMPHITHAPTLARGHKADAQVACWPSPGIATLSVNLPHQREAR